MLDRLSTLLRPSRSRVLADSRSQATSQAASRPSFWSAGLDSDRERFLKAALEKWKWERLSLLSGLNLFDANEIRRAGNVQGEVQMLDYLLGKGAADLEEAFQKTVQT